MDTFFMTGNLMVACMVVGVFIGYGLRQKEFEILKNELAQMKSRYRQAYGFHDWFGIYDLESFDCGRMWYAMITGADGRRLIRGEAEHVFPGLMAEHGILRRQDNESPKRQDEPFSPKKQAVDTFYTDDLYQGSSTPQSESMIRQRAYVREQVRIQSYCRVMPVLHSPSQVVTSKDRQSKC